MSASQQMNTTNSEQTSRSDTPKPSATPSLASATASPALPTWVTWAVLVLTLGGTYLVFHASSPTSGVVAPAVVGLILFFIVMSILFQIREGTRQRKDKMARLTIITAFLLACIPLVSLLVLVIARGVSAMSGTFLVASGEGLEGGIGHAIIGTLEVTLSTAIIAIPIGIFTAIYLVEYGHGWFARVITFLVDIMTGIPSIVAGLFAAALFPVLFRDPGYRSGLEGSVALVVLMTPLVVRNTEEMLRLVSNDLREAAYGLGVTKARTIVSVVLRTAASGIISGCVIATARIIGESAPLLITAGTTDYYNFSLFGDRMMTLPVYVYNQYKGGNFEGAWGAALVLVLIVLLLNLLARFIAKAYAPKGR